MSGWLLLLALLSIGAAAWLVHQRSQSLKRMLAAESEALPSDVCIACGERDIEMVAPAVVRCRACAFVGGEGMAAWQRAQQAQQLAKLSPDERRAVVQGKLREALESLENAHAQLEQAWRASWFALLGLAFESRSREMDALLGGLAQLQVTEGLVQECAWLREGATAPFPPAHHSPLRAALDTEFANVWWVGWAVHQRIKQAREQLRSVRAEAEALARLTSAA